MCSIGYAFGAGRVRLRPNRGFSLDLVQQCHLPSSRSVYLIISRCPNKIRIFGSTIFSLKLMASRIRVDSNDRFIGGHVAGDATRKPGSDGTSAFRSFALSAPGLPASTSVILAAHLVSWEPTSLNVRTEHRLSALPRRGWMTQPRVSTLGNLQINGSP